MFAFSFAALIYGHLLMVHAQSPASFGSCPDHPTVNDFDLSKFQGTWYEIERSFYVFELLGHCPKFTFTLSPDNNLEVKFSMKNRLTGNANTFDGIAFTKFNPAIWDYRVNTNLPRYIARIMPGSGKYYVLDTDYDNYAILWSCSNLGIFHSDLVWILGRRKTLEPEQRSIIYSVLSDLKIDEDRLILSKQAQC